MKRWKRRSLGMLVLMGMVMGMACSDEAGVPPITCETPNTLACGTSCCNPDTEVCDATGNGCKPKVTGLSCEAPNTLVCGTSCCNPDTHVCDATGNGCTVPPFCEGKPNGTPCDNNTGTCQEGECEPLPPPECTPGILHLTVEPSTPAPLSPIDTDTTVSVRVACLANEEDADKVVLDSISLPEGVELLSMQDNGSVEEMGAFTQSFSLTLRYNGTEAFPTGLAAVPFELGIPVGHVLRDRSGNPLELSVEIEVSIRDGQAKTPARVIEVNRANIERFNSYASTGGLARHYVLTEDIELDPPVAPKTSNWTRIGSSSSTSFIGSFDGGGNTISGLIIDSDSLDYQGMFGYVTAGATIERLGLLNINVRGNRYVGGLVGYNHGTVSGSTGMVQNSYAEVQVTGTGDYVGGLVGYSTTTSSSTSSSRVLSSYATGNVTGTSYVGGLVGWNGNDSGGTSRVDNSYATGNVTGTGNYVGGLVGGSGSAYGISTVLNCYATGNVTATGTNTNTGRYVGGLAGSNSGRVEDSYAMGAVTGNGEVGGLVGWNTSIVHNNMALNPKVSGHSNVGRVVGLNSGVNASLLNNLAFAGMLNKDDTDEWSPKGPGTLNGEDRSAEQLQKKEGFHDIFVDPSPASPWTYQPGRLPGLFGQTVAMPAHLQ